MQFYLHETLTRPKNNNSKNNTLFKISFKSVFVGKIENNLKKHLELYYHLKTFNYKSISYVYKYKQKLLNHGM